MHGEENKELSGASVWVNQSLFLSSRSMPFMSFSQLTIFNISTASSDYSPPTTTSTQATCVIGSYSFSSVCDTCEGGVIPFLTASNISFIGCYRTRKAEALLKPRRQSISFDGANTFIWCEWNRSKSTGNNDSSTNGTLSWEVICMCNQSFVTVSVSNCSFNDWGAHYDGGKHILF